MMVLLWDETLRRELFWQLLPNCNPSKVNPPEFTSIASQAHPCNAAMKLDTL